MITVALIFLFALAVFFYFFYLALLNSQRETIRELKMTLEMLERERIDFIKSERAQGRGEVLGSFDLQIAETKKNLNLAIHRYNQSIESQPMKAIARHKQFTREHQVP